MSTKSNHIALLDLFNEARSAAHHAERVKVPFHQAERIRPLNLDGEQFYLRRAPAHEERPAPHNPFPQVPGVCNLSFPAPHREAVSVENGDWIDQPWSLEGVRRELTSGGYFIKGRHTFANSSVAHLAINRKEREAAVAKAPRALFGDEILEQFWAQQAALLPPMKWTE